MMHLIKIVAVPKAAFRFCAFSMLMIFLTSLLLRSKEGVIVGFLLLVISALLRVEKAPLVYFYRKTIHKIIPSEDEMLDENAVLFAHLFAAVLSAVALIFLYGINEIIGWGIVLILVIAKTSAFFGYCGAMKLYTCLTNENGNCCGIGKRLKGE